MYTLIILVIESQHILDHAVDIYVFKIYICTVELRYLELRFLEYIEIPNQLSGPNSLII